MTGSGKFFYIFILIMKKRNILFGQIAFILLCSLLLVTSKLNAQGQISTTILEPIWVVPDTILPIDATDILSSAEATTAILKEISTVMLDSASMADYTNRLNEIIGEIDTIHIELKEYDEDEVGSRLLQYYKNQLSVLQSSITSLKGDLDSKSKELIEIWNRTEFIASTWILTLDPTASEPLSESLKTRSETILAEDIEKRDDIQETGSELMVMADQLLTGSEAVDNLLALMSETEEMVRRNHLKKTHPALWEADTTESKAVSPKILFNIIGGTLKTGYAELYQMYKVSLYLNLVLFIILLFISLLIYNNIKRGKIKSEDERILKFLKIFKRPVAVSLTMALFVSFLLYPNAPQIITDFSALLIVIPLVLVALQVLPKEMHIHLYVISALFLFEKLVDLYLYNNHSLPGLLILFIVLVATAYVIWMIIKRINKYKNAAKRSIKLLDILMWIALITLLISIVTNIAGYVGFSYYLFTGVVMSIMAGILINVCIIIIDGFFSLIIMGNSSQMYGMVKDYGDKLVNRIFRLVKFLGVVYWITLVLKRYLIYNEVIGWLRSVLETKWVINDEMTISLKGIILFGLIIFLSIWIARFLRLLLEKEVFPRVKFGRGIPGMISLIVRYTIISLGFFLSLGVLGVDMTKLTILLGALGVGIGFGLQDIINNLISGFILIFERPIQVGDTVQFGEREGKVKEIGIRSSTIKTYDGSEVIVPNGKLISNELINLTLSDPILRVELNVGTEYGCDPQEVIDILVMQAKLHPDVIPTPEAFAIFFGYGDYALNFRLYAYTLEVNSRLKIRSELNLAIFQAFKEANIKIPYPIQDLNVNIQGDKTPTK